jgi:hypothetical protein
MGSRDKLAKVIADSRFPLFGFAVFLAGVAIGEAVDLVGMPHFALFIWTLAILPFAASFYRLRRRNRIIYGASELLIAVGFFYFLLMGMAFDAKPVTFELITDRMLKFLIAIYFMVRALDNIGEGLKESPSHAKWEAFFFGVG